MVGATRRGGPSQVGPSKGNRPRALARAMASDTSSRKRFSVSGVGFSFGRRRKELVPETNSLSSAPSRNISRKTSVWAKSKLGGDPAELSFA